VGSALSWWGNQMIHRCESARVRAPLGLLGSLGNLSKTAEAWDSNPRKVSLQRFESFRGFDHFSPPLPVRHAPNRAEWSRSGVYGAVQPRGYRALHLPPLGLPATWVASGHPHSPRGAGGAGRLPTACRSSGQRPGKTSQCRSSHQRDRSRDRPPGPSCCCPGQQRLAIGQQQAQRWLPTVKNVGRAVGAQTR